MNTEKINKDYSTFFRKGLWILLIGLIFIIASPIIWTQPGFWFDFSRSGEIGDTIGGLTAPIVGIIGAALVFLSFMEQWKANRIQWDTLMDEKNEKTQNERLNLLWKLYDDIKIELNSKRVTDFNVVIFRGEQLQDIRSERELTIITTSLLSDFKYLQLTFIGMVEAGLKPDYIAVFGYKLITIYTKIIVFNNAIRDNAVGKDKLNEELKLVVQRNEIIQNFNFEN